MGLWKSIGLTVLMAIVCFMIRAIIIEIINLVKGKELEDHEHYKN